MKEATANLNSSGDDKENAAQKKVAKNVGIQSMRPEILERLMHDQVKYLAQYEQEAFIGSTIWKWQAI